MFHINLLRLSISYFVHNIKVEAIMQLLSRINSQYEFNQNIDIFSHEHVLEMSAFKVIDIFALG